MKLKVTPSYLPYMATGSGLSGSLLHAINGHFGKIFSYVPSFISDYSLDVVEPFFLYNLMRLYSSPFINQKTSMLVASAIGFGVPSLMEMHQKTHPASGVYDPNDFIAYAAGIGFAIGFDIFLNKRSKSKLEALEK